MIVTKGNKKRILKRLNPLHSSFVKQIVEQYPDELLHMPSFSSMLAAIGIDSIKKKSIKVADVADKEKLIDNAIEHNLRGLEQKITLYRPYMVTAPLRTIEYITGDPKRLTVLTVGPRTEAEIYALTSLGFDPLNIRGLDLLSYSDFVDVGDMHAMPYPDNCFDVLIASFVLAYSNDPKTAAAEFLRVLRPGGIIVVGCEYTPYSEDELKARGSDVSSAPKYKSVQQILDLFEGSVDYVYFKHDIHPRMRNSPGGLITVFRTVE